MSRRVLIIGAGPAGSTAAILLARGGFDVTIVEQHRFPRDKVCGECLSAAGLDVLSRIGLQRPLQEAGAVVFAYATIHPRAGRPIRLPLARPMWGISRAALDEILLDAARASGAAVLQPARCEALEAGEPPRARVRRLDSNGVVTLEAEQILLADGKSTLLGGAPPRTADFGIKAHFENVDGPRDAIELFGCDGLYGGLAAIESGRWNAGFSVPESRIRAYRGRIAELFDAIVADHRTLAGRLRGARLSGNWLASPLPRFPVRADWPCGVIPIGNSAAALEPIGGEGMGLAMRSAELAAQMILEGGGRPHPVRLAREYRRLWRVRRPACRAGALVVSRAAGGGGLANLLAISPSLTARALRLIGK